MSRKRAIFTIITCSIAVLFLGGILLVGLNSDGFGMLAAHGEERQPFGHGNAVDLEPDSDGLENLEVSWESGPITIKTVSSDKIRVTETSSRPLEESEQMKVSYGGGTLEIKWDHSRLKLFSFPFFGGHSKSLTIELPKALADGLLDIDCSNISGDMEAEGLTSEDGAFSTVSGGIHLSKVDFSGTCTLSSTSGDLTAENLTAQKLDISSTSGALSLASATAEEVTCSTTSGEIYYEGRTQSLSANTVSGVCHASLSACPQELSMDSVSGPLTVELPKSACFTAEHSSISGEFSCDFPQKGEKTYGSGSPTGDLSFSTTSGDVLIIS